MTVPLDTVNDIRSMDAAGRSRSEIARVLHVSRNTVAKYADMEDMSPEPPLPERRRRPALEGHEAWVESVLEADLGAPRKQRHTAKRVFDRLVDERGYEGSYSTVRRFVLDWRQARSAGGGGAGGGRAGRAGLPRLPAVAPQAPARRQRAGAGEQGC